MAKNDAPNVCESTQDTAACASWLQVSIHTYIKILIIASLIITVFHVEVYRIVNRWVTDASWSHGMLIPLFSLYFITLNKKELLSIDTKPSYLGLFFLVICIAFYPLIVFQLKIGYLQSLMLIPMIGSVVLFMGGWKLIRHTWLAICFLFFAIPLPERYYRELTTPMRILAARIAGALLDSVEGLEASINGVVIDIIWKGEQLRPALNVAEACSGMRLLMTFVALGVAMAYLHKRSAWERIVLLCCTVPIAILCNVIRVTVTGFIFVLIAPKYTQGVYHDTLGMLMLPLAFSLYWLIAYFMSSLFMEEKEPVAQEDVIIRRQH